MAFGDTNDSSLEFYTTEKYGKCVGNTPLRCGSWRCRNASERCAGGLSILPHRRLMTTRRQNVEFEASTQTEIEKFTWIASRPRTEKWPLLLPRKMIYKRECIKRVDRIMLWTVLGVFTCVVSQGRSVLNFYLSLIAAFVSRTKSPVFVKLELAQVNNKNHSDCGSALWHQNRNNLPQTKRNVER